MHLLDLSRYMPVQRTSLLCSALFRGIAQLRKPQTRSLAHIETVFDILYTLRTACSRLFEQKKAVGEDAAVASGEWAELARLLVSHKGDGRTVATKASEDADSRMGGGGEEDEVENVSRFPPSRILTESDSHGPPVHSLTQVLAIMCAADEVWEWFLE